MVGTTCRSCTQGTEMRNGPVDPGWEMIGGEWFCPMCVLRLWTPRVWLTRSEVARARTPAGGWTREQLAAWRVPWPPPRAWARVVTGNV
jgi:hypothetical protein